MCFSCVKRPDGQLTRIRMNNMTSSCKHCQSGPGCTLSNMVRKGIARDKILNGNLKLILNSHYSQLLSQHLRVFHTLTIASFFEEFDKSFF